jgi:hypothetical protein
MRNACWPIHVVFLLRLRLFWATADTHENSNHHQQQGSTIMDDNNNDNNDGTGTIQEETPPKA